MAPLSLSHYIKGGREGQIIQFQPMRTLTFTDTHIHTNTPC